MTFLKLLLNINLIFFVTITIVAGKNSENNLIFLHPSYIIALHYDIKISLPHSVTNYTFYGESNVNIIVRHPTQRINLHSVFVDMDKSASLFHEISRRVYKASNYTCQYKLFVCTFHFHDLITIGSYIFKMKYHGTITDRENADGFVITSYLDDERKLKWIYSAGGFQNTIGGQYVFPSLNELMFKATFNITVFHPKHFVAISNMPAATRKNINMNTVRVNFQTTPAMHPHLVAIAVSELDALYSDNGNIALWVRDISVVELMHFTLQVIVASTTYLRDKYFQDDKLNDISTTNHVVIPYHRDDGLPNWGIIFYSEKDVVYNEEWNSIERKTEIASLVARKVTHQFLNKITLSSWTDIWLNEGIAMFLGMHVLDKNFTDLQMMNLIIVRNRFETLHLESIINTPPIVLQIEEPYGIKSYSSFRYNKEHLNNLLYILIIVAFLIIRMLYHLLSDKVFKKGIYNYLKNQTDHVDTFDEPQHSNNIEVTLETLHQCCCNLLCCMGNKPVKIASVNNLWDVMQTALDKSDHENMFDIKEVMNFWITKNQYPVLKVIRNYNNGRTIIWSEMRNTSEQHEWWIPVTYTTQTNLNFSITWPFFQEWITSEKFFINLSLNMNDWIIVNLQQLGYYRVMYDKENWLRLAKHLNSYRYYKIHVLNRAQIIDDAYHFFMMKQLDFEMFKNLTSYLWREKNYVAWYPMFKILRHMFIHSNIFSHPEAEPMKAHMLSIVHNLFEEIGYYNQVYDHIHAISIREEAAEWACFFGDKICRETAYKELQTYMKLAVMHKWLFAADLQGAGARQLFPCWDEPNIRTNFTISVKHDQYYSVLSNTEAIDNFKVRLGKNWSRFETTVKISPYHIMIILHKFKRLNDSNVWCRKNVEQQVKWIHTIAKIATLHLKLKYDDIIYPLTVTHVIIPGFQDTGMSSWGIVLHRETDVLYDKKLDFIAKKFEMAFMIARKMAHQYIGNLLAQSSWSYLWLNEGIATFLAMKIVKQHEHPQLMDLFVVKFQHESLRLNDYYNMSLIDEVDTSSDIASLFPLTYYVRAPIFIRSLDKALPEEILDISINDYISKYKFKSVNTSTSTLEYFLNVIQNNIITEVPEEYKEYTNIIEIFTQWAKQERYPVLQVSQRMSSPNEVKVYIAEPYPKKWSIYVTYITQKNPNIGHKVWLKEPHTDLYLPVNNSDWIIINVEQAGYYRVNYNNNNWEKLGNYLNSREYTNIHVLNRAQIIDDAYYFMSTNNKLNFNIFKALTYYLSKETNYIAWYPMFKILEQISGFFPFLQSSEVKEHFRKILDNVLEKIGYTDIMEENNFTKCLRLEAAKWACTLGSQKCTTTASSELIQLYKNNKHSRIWPEWKKWTYCKGMMVAHNITWKEMLTEYTLDFDNKRLEYLACSENSDNIIFYIKQLKSIYFTKLQYPITIFHSIIARHAKNNLILNYILDNLTSIIPR
ncbi:PREDICTED: aminopeptidase N-like [Cyphomyrmex costatus]|uniref:aminopeptidase N-like n=1 Tax=Cyphomyrmex costatus TaxID=456900 RepID=UPI0008522B0B|nr:PREDICTED: aminopeptidase N-like [Cyphomyrmex costatus]